MQEKLERLCKRVRLATVGFASISALAVIASITMPLSVADYGSQHRSLQRVPKIQPPHEPWNDLQARIMQRDQELIKPLQGIAAVRDDGAAAKMASRLQLQGIVNMGGEYVAYVSVDKGSVVTLRNGATVLEFTVLNVENSRVTLSREGVQVVLP